MVKLACFKGVIVSTTYPYRYRIIEWIENDLVPALPRRGPSSSHRIHLRHKERPLRLLKLSVYSFSVTYQLLFGIAYSECAIIQTLVEKWPVFPEPRSLFQHLHSQNIAKRERCLAGRVSDVTKRVHILLRLGKISHVHLLGFGRLLTDRQLYLSPARGANHLLVETSSETSK